MAPRAVYILNEQKNSETKYHKRVDISEWQIIKIKEFF